MPFPRLPFTLGVCLLITVPGALATPLDVATGAADERLGAVFVYEGDVLATSHPRSANACSGPGVVRLTFIANGNDAVGVVDVRSECGTRADTVTGRYYDWLGGWAFVTPYGGACIDGADGLLPPRALCGWGSWAVLEDTPRGPQLTYEFSAAADVLPVRAVGYVQRMETPTQALSAL